MNDVHALQVFYGGTFDPIHNGHLAIACAARDALDCDIQFIPAADPPHRPPPGAAATDRAEMVRLAIAGLQGLTLDLRELERGGRSWSIDTLRSLRAQLGPQASIAWLVGADSLRDLPTWKDWQDLFELTHFIVAEREGHPLDGELGTSLQRFLDGRWSIDPASLRASPAGRVLRLHQPLQWHSATELRRRIAGRLPWRELVPPAVADFIARRGLYGAPADAVIGP
ncbi:MAG: nicotinate-nucleotide adenylyltransferase [Xanthomonadaceae bacterium]|nr:nicotinate-nucleotide adenylyltransferase [Xanthomonadaceae bacterium]